MNYDDCSFKTVSIDFYECSCSEITYHLDQVYDLVVKGGNMQKCNFDLYSHYKDRWTPETSLTCTRNWYSGRVQSPDALHNYYWPWCVQTIDGSYYGRWDSCYGWFEMACVYYIHSCWQ